MPFMGTFAAGSVNGFGTLKGLGTAPAVLKTVTWGGAVGSSSVNTYSTNNVVTSGTPTNPATRVGSTSPNVASFNSITTLASGVITVGLNGGGGYYGNGSTTPGYIYQYYNIVSPTLAAGTEIVFFAGNAGYGYGDDPADGTAGGAGGFSFVMYADPAGTINFNSKKYTMLALANGGNGGPDGVYTGSTAAPYNASVINTDSTVSGWWNGVSTFVAGTFSRGTGTAYGGYPLGQASDDSYSAGGGNNFNFVKSTSTYSSATVYPTSNYYGLAGAVSIQGYI